MSEAVQTLTNKQGQAIRGIRKRCKAAGLPLPTTDIIAAAHAEAYTIKARDPQKARHAALTIANQNLQRPAFREALLTDSEEIKQYIGEQILANLRGENPVWPKNVELYRDSLKIAARLAWPDKSQVTILEDPYPNRSTAELEFYRDHGRWPEEEEQRPVCGTNNPAWKP